MEPQAKESQTNAEQPQANADQPKPNADQPKPNADQPKPNAEQPQANADQPKPKEPKEEGDYSMRNPKVLCSADPFTPASAPISWLIMLLISLGLLIHLHRQEK